MSAEQKDWLKYFNYALKGDTQSLATKLSIPEELAKELVQYIYDSCNAKRRDLMYRGTRVGLKSETYNALVDRSLYIQFSQRSFRYSPEDYRQIPPMPDSSEPEVLELLSLISNPSSEYRYEDIWEGDIVEVRIKGHFYNKQRGVVLSLDKNRYLIEITSKLSKSSKGRPKVPGKVRLARHEFIKIKTETDVEKAS